MLQGRVVQVRELQVARYVGVCVDPRAEQLHKHEHELEAVHGGRTWAAWIEYYNDGNNEERRRGGAAAHRGLEGDDEGAR